MSRAEQRRLGKIRFHEQLVRERKRAARLTPAVVPTGHDDSVGLPNLENGLRLAGAAGVVFAGSPVEAITTMIQTDQERPVAVAEDVHADGFDTLRDATAPDTFRANMGIQEVQWLDTSAAWVPKGSGNGEQRVGVRTPKPTTSTEVTKASTSTPEATKTPTKLAPYTKPILVREKDKNGEEVITAISAEVQSNLNRRSGPDIKYPRVGSLTANEHILSDGAVVVIPGGTKPADVWLRVIGVWSKDGKLVPLKESFYVSAKYVDLYGKGLKDDKALLQQIRLVPEDELPPEPLAIKPSSGSGTGGGTALPSPQATRPPEATPTPTTAVEAPSKAYPETPPNAPIGSIQDFDNQRLRVEGIPWYSNTGEYGGGTYQDVQGKLVGFQIEGSDVVVSIITDKNSQQVTTVRIANGKSMMFLAERNSQGLIPIYSTDDSSDKLGAFAAYFKEGDPIHLVVAEGFTIPATGTSSWVGTWR